MSKYSCIDDILKDEELTIENKLHEAYHMGLNTGIEAKKEFDLLGSDVFRYYYVFYSYSKDGLERSSGGTFVFKGEFSISDLLTHLSKLLDVREVGIGIQFYKEITFEDYKKWQNKKF